jgi:hypothetical protein
MNNRGTQKHTIYVVARGGPGRGGGGGGGGGRGGRGG